MENFFRKIEKKIRDFFCFVVYTLDEFTPLPLFPKASLDIHTRVQKEAKSDAVVNPSY